MTAPAGMIGRVEIPYVPLPVRVTDHAVARYVDRCGGDVPERWLKGMRRLLRQAREAAERRQCFGIAKRGHRVDGMHDRLADRHEEQTQVSPDDN